MSEHKVNPFARGTGVSLPPMVRDLYGRELVVGDKVALHLQAPSLFLVTSITPVMDPTAPANLMEVVVACRLRFLAPRDQPNAEFVRVVSVTEGPTQMREPPPAGLVEGPDPRD